MNEKLLPLQNLHTHSTFCDGSDSLEDIVKSAVTMGFEAIGFSSHSFTPFDTSYCMKDESGYIEKCRKLKSDYLGKINILCGIELDYYSDEPEYPYDYVIGSVHYIRKDGEYLAVDESAEILENGVKHLYFGDMTALCRDYYKLVSEFADKKSCRIIGHFDLITKFIERSPGIIDTESSDYIRAQDEALKKLIAADKLFEVNTGAMARGYRTEPYPSIRVLKRIRELGGKVILTSDCHKKEQLDYGFKAALDTIKRCGFKEIYCYNNGKFSPFDI